MLRSDLLAAEEGLIGFEMVLAEQLQEPEHFGHLAWSQLVLSIRTMVRARLSAFARGQSGGFLPGRA